MAPALTSDAPRAVWAYTLANGLRIWGETRPHSRSIAARVVAGARARHAARR